MSDSRRMAVTRLLGIAALAGVFVVCMDRNRVSDSPFQQARYRLRIGMTPGEAYAAANLGVPAGSSGSATYWYCFFWDAQRDEILDLNFDTTGFGAGTASERLTNWSVKKTVAYVAH